MSPLTSLPPIFTGVWLVVLTARMLPLSGLGWPNRRELPLVVTVPWVAMPYWKMLLFFWTSSKSSLMERIPAMEVVMMWRPMEVTRTLGPLGSVMSVIVN